ncbi:hypothetical protein M432DRAFT_470865 [Thermoascus aurantiacus ATCC 26904]
MTSYWASLTSSSAISNLGTRLNSLRRAITSSDEADDPDNEDCSHISNVLRAYYIEKGRPFPPWLPPDPKGPPPPQPRVIATTQVALQQGYGGQTPAKSGGGRGGLGDLWGDSGSSEPPASQTSSLRRPRVQTPAAANSSAGAAQTPTTSSGPRPLPSQRAGSYQSTQSQGRGGLERMGSAQERLRARLQGGSSSSSSSAASTPSPSSSSAMPASLTPGYGGGGGASRPGTPSGGYTAYSGGGDGAGAVPRKPLGSGIGLPSGPKLRR